MAETYQDLFVNTLLFVHVSLEVRKLLFSVYGKGPSHARVLWSLLGGKGDGCEGLVGGISEWYSFLLLPFSQTPLALNIQYAKGWRALNSTSVLTSTARWPAE